MFYRVDRLVTAPLRTYPNFLIIGAQRCGTTSLYNFLTEHSCILPALKKEVHFFDINYRRGDYWYRAHFPLSKHIFKDARDDEAVITGEATPYYLFHPLAAARVYQKIPDVKIIIMLRNPVDRAYSHYHHECDIEIEKLSFEDAVKAETERLKGEEDKMIHRPRYRGFYHQHFSYLARGIYVDQLKRWTPFFSKDQILILKSEDFFSNTQVSMKRVFEFLNIKAFKLNHYKIYNQINYSDMNPETRSRLSEYFHDHNERLYEYLGVDFHWNKKP
jgi:hypothetical protein